MNTHHEFSNQEREFQIGYCLVEIELIKHELQSLATNSFEWLEEHRKSKFFDGILNFLVIFNASSLRKTQALEFKSMVQVGLVTDEVYGVRLAVQRTGMLAHVAD